MWTVGIVSSSEAAAPVRRERLLNGELAEGVGFEPTIPETGISA